MKIKMRQKVRSAILISTFILLVFQTTINTNSLILSEEVSLNSFKHKS